MMQFENPIRLVKELKGAALSVLVLLSLAPIPVTQRWLEIHSGYSDKPVSDALYYLREHGFVVKSNEGWLLSDCVQHLPLPMGEPRSRMEDGEESSLETYQEEVSTDQQENGPVDTGLGSSNELHEGDEKPEDCPQIMDEPVESRCKSLSDKSDWNGGCRKVSDSLSSSINNNKNKLIKYFINTTKQTRKNSGYDPPTKPGTAASTTRFMDDGLDNAASQDDYRQDVLQTFSDCVIRINRRTHPLAEMERLFQLSRMVKHHSVYFFRTAKWSSPWKNGKPFDG